MIRSLGMSLVALVTALGSVWMVTTSSALAADNYVMPQELVEKARASDCEQVKDFYKRPGLVGPPYAFWSTADGDEAGVAFWCQKERGEALEYMLLIENRTKHSPFWGCASTIRTKNYPGGLAVRPEKKLKLDAFVAIRDPRKRGPSAPLRKPALISEYDGTAEIFYCHDGEWLVSVRH